MTKPVTIPNTFATATTAIPLSQLDGDFTAVATAINDANTYSNYAADTGSANAYVVTFSGVSTAYSAGLGFNSKPVMRTPVHQQLTSMRRVLRASPIKMVMRLHQEPLQLIPLWM